MTYEEALERWQKAHHYFGNGLTPKTDAPHFETYSNLLITPVEGTPAFESFISELKECFLMNPTPQVLINFPKYVAFKDEVSLVECEITANEKKEMIDFSFKVIKNPERFDLL